MADKAYRVDFTGRAVNGAQTVFHYSTHGYVTPASHPTIPSTYVESRLKQPLLFSRDMYGSLRTYGAVEIPHGEFVLANFDGGLDTLLDYGFDGGQFDLWEIDRTGVVADALVYRGVMESVTMTRQEFRGLVRDEIYAFDRPIQPVKYSGSGTLEGSTSDIVGRPKPFIFGAVENAQPVLVNNSLLIYQLHHGPLAGGGTPIIWAVRDKMVQLTGGLLRPLSDLSVAGVTKTVSGINTATDVWTTSTAHGFSTADPVFIKSTAALPSEAGGGLYNIYYYVRVLSTTTFTLHSSAADASAGTNVLDMTTAGTGTVSVTKNVTPTGYYDWSIDSTGVFFRLGSTPVGTVTIKFWDRWSSGTTGGSTAQVLQAIAAKAGTYTIDDRTGVSAVTCGIYIRDEMTILEAMQRISAGQNVSFQVYPNQLSGKYITLHQLKVPTGSPALSLNTSNILDDTGVERVQPGDPERGIPPWRHNIGNAFNDTVMSGGDVASGNPSLLEFASNQWRYWQEDQAGITLRFPLAPERVIPALVPGVSEAGVLGVYWRTVHSALADIFTLSIPMELYDGVVNTDVSGVAIPGPMLGAVVSLTYPRFGLASGKLCMLIGYAVDFQKRKIDLVLWTQH